jgi:YD repeat-containing protein
MLSQVSDGLGRMLTFLHDPTGLIMQVSDGTRSVTFGYTGGVLTSVTDAAGHTTSYAYAVPAAFPGLFQSATEPLGNVPMSCGYDGLGRVMSMTDAFGHASTFAYDTPSGNTWTDALGHTWTYVHDASSHLTGLLQPGPVQRSFTYDASGRLASLTRPLGDVTSFTYDATSGDPASVTMGDGSVFIWSYSSHASGGATFYDLAGATYPDGRTESFTRDAAGNVTNWMDRGGFHWMGTYNARGQALTGTNPAGGVSTFAYDTQGRLATAADNAGRTTGYAYDALDRLTKLTRPDGAFQTFPSPRRNPTTSSAVPGTSTVRAAGNGS